MTMYKCPQCGHTERFFIAAVADVEVDGETGYVEDHEGFSWDGDSVCICSNCFHEDKERKFRQED